MTFQEAIEKLTQIKRGYKAQPYLEALDLAISALAGVSPVPPEAVEKGTDGNNNRLDDKSRAAVGSPVGGADVVAEVESTPLGSVQMTQARPDHSGAVTSAPRADPRDAIVQPQCSCAHRVSDAEPPCPVHPQETP